jgi:probable F420-dependent oxidoreductase
VSIPQVWDNSSADRYGKTYELAQVAEAEGYDAVTIGHHHFMPDRMSDPFILLAGIAARTTTIRLGTGIFQAAIHHPLRVAEQAACLDQLSNGRVVLGVGLGWSQLEYESFGAEFRKRGARMDEALALVRRLWTEEKVAHDGRFFRLPELTMEPRPIQPDGPPIWVAGVDPRALDRAARLGDAWMCGPVQTWTAAKACLVRYRASCEAAGTVPAWVLRRYTRITADRRQLEEEYLPDFVDAQLAYWRTSVETDEERAMFARLDAGERLSPAEIAADRFVGGTPDDVIAELQRYHDETGCDYVHVGCGGRLDSYAADTVAGAAQLQEMRDQIQRFARQVAPALS